MYEIKGAASLEGGVRNVNPEYDEYMLMTHYNQQNEGVVTNELPGNYTDDSE